MTGLFVILFLLAALAAALVFSLKSLIHICAPNEVLIFSGRRVQIGPRTFGYRLVKGGRGVRVPLLERVDRMDLTNMVIELTVRNAYAKGGIPLTVQGVANVKVAGHEPNIRFAIERFLGKSRTEIVLIAKATLEGCLRGVLATLTPEQVNEDRDEFARMLVSQVEDDLNALGLIVDTLKIQNVHDDVQYLSSIGRKKGAEVIKRARVSEALAKAEAVVRSAENKEREQRAKIAAQGDMARADADRRLAEVTSRRDALVAEERATVLAEVAKSRAELEVQRARIEQVRRQLDADVLQPAKAAYLAAEAAARADAAPVVQDGAARADALRTLAATWASAGDNARQLFLMQKLDPIVRLLTSTVAETDVERMTMIDGQAPGLAGSGTQGLATRAIGTSAQLEATLGVDVLGKLAGLVSAPPSSAATSGALPVQGKPTR